jgi:hypothetical protein
MPIGLLPGTRIGLAGAPHHFNARSAQEQADLNVRGEFFAFTQL